MVTITTHTTRSMIAALALAFSAVLAAPIAGHAQSASDKPAEQKGPADKREAVPKRIDQIAEVGRLLTGPAANPECVWLGRRVLNRLWADDLDTAFRHLDLYDRFGCPGGHIQATFRCLVRQGETDPKAPADALNDRIHVCWINPSTQQGAPSTTAQSPATQPPEAGTTTR
jgi:hypothetical protein